MPETGGRILIASDGVWDAFEKMLRVSRMSRSCPPRWAMRPVPFETGSLHTQEAMHELMATRAPGSVGHALHHERFWHCIFLKDSRKALCHQ